MQLAAAYPERRPHQHLETMRQEYRAHREAYRKEGEHAVQQSNDLQDKIHDLQRRIRQLAEPEKLAQDRKELDSLTTKVVSQETTRRQLAAHELDMQQLLGAVPERLPESALTLQRSRARLDSLEKLHEAHLKRSASGSEARSNTFSRRVENESLVIEITICKQLLAEVQGKLARLRPVRFEVIRPQ